MTSDLQALGASALCKAASHRTSVIRRCGGRGASGGRWHSCGSIGSHGAATAAPTRGGVRAVRGGDTYAWRALASGWSAARRRRSPRPAGRGPERARVRRAGQARGSRAPARPTSPGSCRSRPRAPLGVPLPRPLSCTRRLHVRRSPAPCCAECGAPGLHSARDPGVSRMSSHQPASPCDTRSGLLGGRLGPAGSHTGPPAPGASGAGVSVRSPISCNWGRGRAAPCLRAGLAFFGVMERKKLNSPCS